jgi:hypothetical protein
VKLVVEDTERYPTRQILPGVESAPAPPPATRQRYRALAMKARRFVCPTSIGFSST